jgi:hypothetical protein
LLASLVATGQWGYNWTVLAGLAVKQNWPLGSQVRSWPTTSAYSGRNTTTACCISTAVYIWL